MGDSLPVRVLGADGCRGGGWVVAVLAERVSWSWAPDTAAVLALADELAADAVALDVPIGLPALGRTRACDDLARRRLGARRASVFAAPPREVLGCASYAEARPLAPSLSAQAFGLVPRIRDVDAVLRDRGPQVHGVVVEAHPELAFAALGGLVPPKKTAPGALARLALLELAVGPLPADAPVQAALDDALDAVAVALVARRWAAGEAEVLGGEPDALGTPMRIVL